MGNAGVEDDGYVNTPFWDFAYGSCESTDCAIESSVEPLAASKTSAVFVSNITFDEPMEYPQGAKLIYRPVLASPLRVGSEIRT
jgi:hypothetical protein